MKTNINIAEIQYLQKRIDEINSLNLEDIAFLDGDFNEIVISDKIKDDWKYSGLGIVHFITTDFYKEGFTETTQD